MEDEDGVVEVHRTNLEVNTQLSLSHEKHSGSLGIQMNRGIKITIKHDQRDPLVATIESLVFRIGRHDLSSFPTAAS